jgi:thioredoxin reductase/ferredoxin
MAKKILDLISNNIYLFGVGFFVVVAWWNVSKKNKQQQAAKKILEKAKQTRSDEPPSLHPQVDPAKCAGCGACTRVCPEGDILKMINHKAVLVTPTKCVGHGECEAACPFGAIDLVFGTKTRGKDIPRVTTHYETNVPGLYIAGELGGMGLIRNAIKQGAIAAEHALAQAPLSGNADYDLFVVGSGPAGIAASLSAIVHRARYLCVEQNSFGGTVANFPRQKIVMTHPADLPAVGKMQFEENKVSKERLLRYWEKVRQNTGLRVNTNEKFESLEKLGDVFEIKTSKGKYTAKKVVLAMGVRGTPRKLGLPNEDLPKVTYNLLEPEQYQGKRVAIVGGGNAAVEAAQQLGKMNLRNQVVLLVRGDVLDRCNEENRLLIEKMQQQRLVDIWYQSAVKEIQPEHLTIDRQGKEVRLNNDFLFIFAGAEMPNQYLMSLGIQIEKKFGEGLSKKRPSAS